MTNIVDNSTRFLMQAKQLLCVQMIAAILKYPFLVFAIAPLFFSAASSCGQKVNQKLGVDSTVQYETLHKYGPWDDRNYQLTRSDLAVLAENEAELRDPIPAFFRVELRKNNPDMPKSGPAQYPRSALPLFLQKYGGYLIKGRLYDQIQVENGIYIVVQESGIDYQEWRKQQGH